MGGGGGGGPQGVLQHRPWEPRREAKWLLAGVGNLSRQGPLGDLQHHPRGHTLATDLVQHLMNSAGPDQTISRAFDSWTRGSPPWSRRTQKGSAMS